MKVKSGANAKVNNAVNPGITWLGLVRGDGVFAKFRWCLCKGGWCSYSGYHNIYILIWMIQVGLGHRKGGPDHANIP